MLTFKLEKNVILYKNQFEKLSLNVFQDNRLDRYSLELDALLFRLKYMCKHNKDLDKLDDIKKQFTEKSLQLRDSFSEIILALLADIIKIKDPFKLDDIIDIMAQDVNMDQTYVKFKMIIISSNKSYLVRLYF